jgi:hypothetical protein
MLAPSPPSRPPNPPINHGRLLCLQRFLLFPSTIVFFGDNELLCAECPTKEGSLNINGGFTQFKGCSDNKRNTTTAMQNSIQQQPCKTTIHEEGYHHGVTPNATYIHVDWDFYVLLSPQCITRSIDVSSCDIYGATSIHSRLALFRGLSFAASSFYERVRHQRS